MAKGNKKTKNNQPSVTEAVEQQKKKEQERKEEVKQAVQQIPPKAKTSSEKKSPVKKSPESETVKKCNCGCKDCTCGKECNCGEECKCNCGCKDCNCGKECKCVKKECCCPFKCIFHHLYPLIIALLLSIGFVFYLIIRDEPTVTYDLCKSDAKECISRIVTVLTPYFNPYTLIAYLHEKGYVH